MANLYIVKNKLGVTDSKKQNILGKWKSQTTESADF